MCDDIATSVSKGCFAYPGKRKRVDQENYLPSVDSFVKTRFSLYEEQWDFLQIQIDVLKSDLNSEIFDSLIQFLKMCHLDRDDFAQQKTQGEIPTAVLITGVNTPDHAVMFSNLESILKSSVSPFIVRLLSKDCSKLSALIKGIVSQLTSVIVDDNDESYDAEEGNKTNHREDSPIKLKKTAKNGRKDISMMSVVKWYKKILSEKTSKEMNVSGATLDTSTSQTVLSKQLIVIVFEDVENIPAKVLQDFVSVCSSYLHVLPIVFVMGVATSVSSLHQLLPSSVSSLLCMDMFQAPPASSYLACLLDKIIMSADVPFKLGPKVFHFFLDNFLYHNFSIMNFTLGFRYCMMEHFLKNPLSVLCCRLEDVDKMIADLSHAQLKYIRKQAAFTQLVQASSDVPEDMTCDVSTKGFLHTAIMSFHTYHQELFVMLRFLHSLVSSLPKYPLGKHFRELYSLCLRENLTETDDFTQAFSLLRFMSRDELTNLLNQSFPVLVKVKRLTNGIRRVYKDVKCLKKRLTKLDEEKILQEEMDQDIAATDISQRVLPQRAKLHELKETLLSMSSKRKRSPYERLREEIVDSLVSLFSSFLKCAMRQPLCNVFYFNDLASVKDLFRPAPRCSIQRALTEPNKYLNCVCCQCDSESILPSMPDICIVYKLHLECGSLVNLFDWMQAFTTVVAQTGESVNKKKKRSNKKPEAEYHARFIRAVSELEFLGFVKATTRKTDHVKKLTW